MDTLKKILITEKNFRVIWDHFMTNFAENPTFLRKGKKAKHPLVKKLLKLIGQQIFSGQDIQITHFMLLKVNKTKMVHGSFFMNNRIGMVFYCDDINMGLVALSTSSEGGSIFRITGQMMDKDLNISSMHDGKAFIPETPKTIQ